MSAILFQTATSHAADGGALVDLIAEVNGDGHPDPVFVNRGGVDVLPGDGLRGFPAGCAEVAGASPTDRTTAPHASVTPDPAGSLQGDAQRGH